MPRRRRSSNSMNQLKKGLAEAFSGAAIGFALAVIIDSFAKDGLIPWYIHALLILVGIIGSVAIIEGFKSKGIFYIVGWIIGSWLLKDLLGPVDFILLIVVPIGIVVVRLWLSFNRGRSRKRIW